MSNGRCDAYRCGLGGAENRKYARHCSEKQNPKGPGGAKRAKGIASRSAFGVTLGLLCGHFGVTLRTLGLLWLYRGYFIIIFVRFQKTPISAIDLNDFIELWGEFCTDFEVTLVPLLAYEGDFGTTLGSFWDKFGHINVEWQV